MKKLLILSLTVFVLSTISATGPLTQFNDEATCCTAMKAADNNYYKFETGNSCAGAATEWASDYKEISKSC